MSYNAILFALIAGVLTIILMVSLDPLTPLLVTNIMLAALVGILIDKKKS